MSRLAQALLVVLAIAGVAHRAETQSNEETVAGVLSVTSIDRQDGSPVPPIFALVDGSGHLVPLEFDDGRLLGAALAAVNRQVLIAGAWSVEPPDAPRLHVRAIHAPADDATEAGSAAAVQGNLRYITVLCRFADLTAVTPKPLSYYQALSGSALPSFDHYNREASEGRLAMTGSAAAGWFNLPQPAAAYTPGGGFDFAKLSADCAAAADATVFFPAYDGINFVFNGPIGGGAAGVGTTAQSLTIDGQTRNYRATFTATGSNTWLFFHEMGHTLGLLHSSGPYATAYDSAWTPMSGAVGARLPDPLGAGVLPAHYLAYEKSVLGWIPPTREHVLTAGETSTLTLERHARPASPDGLLYVRIPVGGQAGRFYTVETRLFDGYDASVPGEAVVIHDVLTSRSDRTAQVVDPDGNGDPNDAGAMWTPGETFVDAPNDISVTVVARAANGFVVTVHRGGTPPAVSIDDVAVGEGNAGTTDAVFTVSLSAADDATVSVRYVVANATATAGTDYGSTAGVLTFLPGTTTQPLHVGVLGDRVFEGNETFVVSLSNPLGAIIGDGQGVGTIMDDDPQGLVVNDVTITEPRTGNTTGVFTVTLSPPNTAQTVTVNYATANGTASALDYTATNGLLSFPPNTTTLPINVTVNTDALLEGPETFFVNLSGANGAAIAYPQGTGTIVEPGLNTVAPCRVADTRDLPGLLGGPALTANTTRTFPIAGRCGVPATARAVSVNLTVTAPTGAGNLRLYPGSGSVPSASTINYLSGQTRANNAIIPLGPSGDLAVFCGQSTGTIHLILDVNAYLH